MTNTRGEGPKPSNEITTKTNHILAIAIDAYKHQRPLSNPVDDCNKLTTLLTERYNFDKNNIQFLYNQNATRGTILTALSNYEHTLSPKDNLMIIFSGHGSYKKSTDQGFWIPFGAKGDYDYITGEDIKAKLKALNVHHIIVIADSCFSGALARSTTETPKIKNEAAAIKLYQKKSRWVLSSGRVELVYDGNAGKNSPFMQSLLSELEHNDKNMLRLSELGVAVTNITNRNANQTPACNYLRAVGDMNGEFSFILKNNKPNFEHVQIGASTPPKEAISVQEPIVINTVADLKKVVRRLVLNGQIKDALILMEEKIKDSFLGYSTILINLSAINILEKKIAKGIADREVFHRAKINSAIDTLLQQIAEKDLK